MTTDEPRLRRLVAIGELDSRYVTDLPVYARGLRHIEARWLLLHDPSRHPATAREIERGYELRGLILESAGYAVRRQPDGDLRTATERRIARINEGRGHADMVQDLAACAVLAEDLRPALTAINFPFVWAQEADRLAGQLGMVLRVSDEEQQGTLRLRNQALTLVLTALWEIRAAATYLSRADPDRQAAYRSPYLRRLRRQAAAGRVDAEAAPAGDPTPAEPVS